MFWFLSSLQIDILPNDNDDKTVNDVDQITTSKTESIRTNRSVLYDLHMLSCILSGC